MRSRAFRIKLGSDIRCLSLWSNAKSDARYIRINPKSLSHALIGGVALLLVAGLTPLGPFLEQRLVTHVLGLYPLNIAGGALIGASLAQGRAFRWTAAPALLAALLTLVFWVLPRWIDASLADTGVHGVRTASLTLLAGLPLGWGWAQAGPVLRGFLVANSAAMLAVMGWLMLVVPSRLCNAYLLTDQRSLGIGLLFAAAGLLVAFLVPVLTGPVSHTDRIGYEPANDPNA